MRRPQPVLPDTEVHDVPRDVNGLDFALQLGGVLFTVLLSPEQAVSWPPRRC